ncbi:hypothetical protein [Actinomadura sp. HBU206391]|uniref:hypothetical protein n=1 Tax=Actinomadura sp. HBU206391 TaxID=2731692 RepID=UPI00164F5176|nr:hypothetical protein [Actinomadura sp. HBU206391]MBC6460187.1 hypothetical protein [Actinomadura sp. HBU206391]
MQVFSKFVHAAILGGALALVVACGGGGSGDSDSGSVPGTGSLPNAGGAGGGGGDSDENCKRLTKDEVTQVIGPNDGGKHDYTFGGCVWTATSAKAGAPEGFNEAIFAAVLPKDQYESIAEIGEPVAGLVEGATYDNTHGELWFPCRSGEFCGIKVRTVSSDNRQENALRLAKLLQGRV